MNKRYGDKNVKYAIATNMKYNERISNEHFKSCKRQVRNQRKFGKKEDGYQDLVRKERNIKYRTYLMVLSLESMNL